jgi:heme A synthase
MPLLTLIIALVSVGVVLYCINRFVPMEPSIKKILNIVVILVLVLVALDAFGVIDALRGVQVPRAHR